MGFIAFLSCVYDMLSYLQPVVIFGKPKENGFFPGLAREDFILLENDGVMVYPTRSEIQALIATRYEEFHGRVFPFDLQRQ